ncbi:lactonase family protein [Microbacterium sp. Marseille-Q6965]|uniref:lactonase family protein n=1 Tax=Microbacterium sp. Marseille-Q6965 TaxID=2965072 RepID=UPI0021B6F315|nr:lactonase family protein [Microbacterium sp. Marseille-Q6965]
MRFFIGGRGADLGGEGVGIGVVTAGEAESPLASGALAHRGDAVEVPSPTWLAPHPSAPVVYAALEGSGRVAAFRRTGEATLQPLGEQVDAGEAVCHVAAAPDGSRLVASCWGDGRVVHIPLARDGRLGDPAIAPAARDPYRPADPLSSVAGQDAVDAVAGGEDPAEIAARLLRQASGEPEPALPDWAGAVDLSALVAGGGDPSRIAAMLAGTDDGSDPAAELRALLGGTTDPFDDPAVRDLLRRDASGSEGDALTDALRGAAPAPAEPRPSRAHAALFLPDGRVATTDLGYDLVRIWRVGAAGLVPDHEVVLPFGTGPRHLVLHPSGFVYVVTELSCEVFVLARAADGRYVLRAGAQTGAAEGDTAAELAPSRDGAFLYAGLRGSDTISVLRVAGDGDRLERVALAESGIVTPRHHVIVRDTLLVAGQGSSEIVSLPLDERTGFPGSVRQRLDYPTPTRILPLAR